jgi:hypothetical protein
MHCRRVQEFSSVVKYVPFGVGAGTKLEWACESDLEAWRLWKAIDLGPDRVMCRSRCVGCRASVLMVSQEEQPLAILGDAELGSSQLVSLGVIPLAKPLQDPV